MRKALIDTLASIARSDKDVYLLTADMGFGLVEPFSEEFPKRFINIGVAEQNMVGVATGLALSGKKVFCYSIANFPTLRCLEQIRNDVCYHDLPVCIVSGGAGLWYGALGMTHHAVEDIAVMRCLPNMSVVSPCCAEETVVAVAAIYLRRQPCYLRMSRSSGTVLPRRHYKFGRAATLTGSTGADITIIATGGQMIANALLASAQLQRKRIRARVLNMHTIKPIDRDAITDAIVETKAILTVEEHSIIGGLGSAVAEIVAETGKAVPVKRIGVADRYLTTAMSYEELLAANHLTVDNIVKEVQDALS